MFQTKFEQALAIAGEGCCSPGILVAGARGLLAYMVLAIQVEFGLGSFAGQVRPFPQSASRRSGPVGLPQFFCPLPGRPVHRSELGQPVGASRGHYSA